MEKQEAKISNWIQKNLDDGRVFLIGEITGHPKYGDFLGRTGEIVEINVDEGFAESHKTYYKLGPIHPQVN